MKFEPSLNPRLTQNSPALWAALELCSHTHKSEWPTPALEGYPQLVLALGLEPQFSRFKLDQSGLEVLLKSLAFFHSERRR